jgi:hypothetical protein
MDNFKEKCRLVKFVQNDRNMNVLVVCMGISIFKWAGVTREGKKKFEQGSFIYKVKF